MTSVDDTIGSSKYQEYNLERFLYWKIVNGLFVGCYTYGANNPCIFMTRKCLAINEKKSYMYIEIRVGRGNRDNNFLLSVQKNGRFC